MVGVFCFESTWTSWSDEQLATELRGLRAMGATAIVTETIEPPIRLMQAAEGAGLEAHLSVPCFSAHAYPMLIEGMDVHPIQADGSRRRQMEWYTGVIPTHEGYNRSLSERIRGIANARPAGVILDFIRWPLHWELELRASTPEPDESSFDARSMAAFATWLEDRGTPAGGDLDPATLLGPLREHWHQFKCDVITGFACDAAASVRAIDANITVGAFIVPAGHGDRRRLVGQDVGSLSRCLDVLYPMTYHAILQEKPTLVGRVVRDIARRSSAAVIPVVQVTADREVAGPWDWGAPFPADELGLIIDEALGQAPGIVLFTLEGLDAQRRDTVSKTLRQRRRQAPPPAR
jgi:hypothetical protein